MRGLVLTRAAAMELHDYIREARENSPSGTVERRLWRPVLASLIDLDNKLYALLNKLGTDKSVRLSLTDVQIGTIMYVYETYHLYLTNSSNELAKLHQSHI